MTNTQIVAFFIVSLSAAAPTSVILEEPVSTQLRAQQEEFRPEPLPRSYNGLTLGARFDPESFPNANIYYDSHYVCLNEGTEQMISAILTADKKICEINWHVSIDDPITISRVRNAAFAKYRGLSRTESELEVPYGPAGYSLSFRDELTGLTIWADRFAKKIDFRLTDLSCPIELSEQESLALERREHAKQFLPPFTPDLEPATANPLPRSGSGFHLGQVLTPQDEYYLDRQSSYPFGKFRIDGFMSSIIGWVDIRDDQHVIVDISWNLKLHTSINPADIRNAAHDLYRFYYCRETQYKYSSIGYDYIVTFRDKDTQLDIYAYKNGNVSINVTDFETRSKEQDEHKLEEDDLSDPEIRDCVFAILP